MADKIIKDLCTESSSQVQHIITSPDQLPREVYLDILSRLPILSLLDCKLVSRLWHTSIKDPLLAILHLTRACNNSLCLLIFSVWPEMKLQLVDAGNLETMIVKTPKSPFPRRGFEFGVVGSCNGVLCFYRNYYDDPDPLLICNPFTIECMELPKIGVSVLMDTVRVVYGFGFHPKTEEHKVIAIIYYGGSPFAFVLTLGVAPTWRNIGQIEHDLIGPSSEVLVNGKLHWLTGYQGGEGARYRNIVSFDLETEQFQVVARPDFEGSRVLDYLVTLKGCLSAIVWRNDRSNKEWIMRESIWSKEFVVRDYVPRNWRADMARFARERIFQVLCELNNGEVLFLCRCTCIVEEWRVQRHQLSGTSASI